MVNCGEIVSSTSNARFHRTAGAFQKPGLEQLIEQCYELIFFDQPWLDGQPWRLPTPTQILAGTPPYNADYVGRTPQLCSEG